MIYHQNLTEFLEFYKIYCACNTAACKNLLHVKSLKLGMSIRLMSQSKLKLSYLYELENRLIDFSFRTKEWYEVGIIDIGF